MKYKQLSKSGVKVSEICLGTAFCGQKDDTVYEQVIHRALKLGCNFLDCANFYGRDRSETIVGKVLKGVRDDVVLSSKVWSRMGDGPNDAGLSRFSIMREIERSLRRLHTDHLDIYLPPSEVDFLLDQMIARGFSGLKTIENNNFSSELTVVLASFLVTTIEEREELRSLGGDRFLVDGDLAVRGSTIAHMEPLLTLVEVTSAVEIDRNPQLINLNGLFSLRTVGKSLGVRGNSALRSLTGLNRVRTVKENLIIFRNRQLESLNALRRLRVVGESIEIRENSVLPDSAITAFRAAMVRRGFGGGFLNVKNGP